jgi:nanoRNase/pAp phosphatase (c-di-AMP/oligoRNAs hydrolase)
VEPLVIFHSINGTMHCDDGFGAAWVAHQAMPNAKFLPGIYGHPPPYGAVMGRDVYLVDFSYRRGDIEQIFESAKSLTIIDHHKTAEAELKGAPGDLTFDMSHSGAVLAWQRWFNGSPPDLLLRIEDGDLWRWQYEDSRFVQAALRSYPHDFGTWSTLMRMPIEDLAAEGVAIKRFIDAKLRETLPNARMGKIAGHEVEIVNCPAFMVSDIANEMAASGKGPFAAAYVDGAGQRVWSLRSIGDFDVSDIAKKFGGGGHKNAAGFTVPLA